MIGIQNSKIINVITKKNIVILNIYKAKYEKQRFTLISWAKIFCQFNKLQLWQCYFAHLREVLFSVVEPLDNNLCIYHILKIKHGLFFAI